MHESIYSIKRKDHTITKEHGIYTSYDDGDKKNSNSNSKNNINSSNNNTHVVIIIIIIIIIILTNCFEIWCLFYIATIQERHYNTDFVNNKLKKLNIKKCPADYRNRFLFWSYWKFS